MRRFRRQWPERGLSDLHWEGEDRHQPALRMSEGERLAITKSRHQK
jgi:hypothetical protein